MKIYLDSNVIISSLISKNGASYLIVKNINSNLKLSNYSLEELRKVSQRLNLKSSGLEELISQKFLVFSLKLSLMQIQKKYQHLVKDVNDAHIIASAINAKSKFLITHNIKDFQKDLIKEEFSITVLTPAQFLQYLRNRD